MLARLLYPSRAIDAECPPIGDFVTIDGTDLHFVEAGRTDAPVLVLIHGASGNARDWTSSIFDDLARDWRVIAFDRPGYGHSGFLPEGSWLIAAQVNVLRQAMRKLGHRRYGIFAHSYGVAVALDWALRYPEEVTGMLNMSGAMTSWQGFLGWRYRWGGRAAIGQLMGALVPLIASDALLARELTEVFQPQPVPPGYVQEGGVKLALRPRTFALNLRAMDSLYAQTRAFLPDVAGINCPCIVLHGAADAIVPFDYASAPISALVPGSTLTLLDNIGHMPHHVAKVDILKCTAQLTNIVEF